jgi:hypothetical protein
MVILFVLKKKDFLPFSPSPFTFTMSSFLSLLWPSATPAPIEHSPAAVPEEERPETETMTMIRNLQNETMSMIRALAQEVEKQREESEHEISKLRLGLEHLEMKFERAEKLEKGLKRSADQPDEESMKRQRMAQRESSEDTEMKNEEGTKPTDEKKKKKGKKSKVMNLGQF